MNFDHRVFLEKYQKLGRSPIFIGSVVAHENVRAAILREDDVSARRIPFILSTPGFKEDGFAINQAGWDLSYFRKNPTVLWVHNASVLPVARSVYEKIEEVDEYGQSLVGVAEFPTAEIHPFADTVYKMYREGFLRGVSVGWTSTDWEFIEKEDEIVGVFFKSQTLWEYSCCPLPADPSALAKIARELNIAGSTIADKESTFMFGDTLEKYSPVMYSIPSEGAVVGLNSKQEKDADRIEDSEQSGIVLFTISDALAEDEGDGIDFADEKQLVAEYATDQDGNLNMAKYAGAFLYCGDIRSISSCIGLHHRIIDDKLTTSKAGIYRVAQMLQQGALSVPQKYHEAVRQHIAEHFREFGIIAPWDRAEGKIYDETLRLIGSGKFTGETLSGLMNTAINVATILYGDKRIPEAWERGSIDRILSSILCNHGVHGEDIYDTISQIRSVTQQEKVHEILEIGKDISIDQVKQGLVAGEKLNDLIETTRSENVEEMCAKVRMLIWNLYEVEYQKEEEARVLELATQKLQRVFSEDEPLEIKIKGLFQQILRDSPPIVRNA